MTATAKVPIWLDCDPGHDDAFAILMAAYHSSFRLLGVSTVHGNASLQKTTNNALSVLRAIGREDVPVFPGASKPFCREHRAAADIHGESGLDGTDLLPQPSRKPLTHCNTFREIRDALMACPPQTAWLVSTGTMTNVAYVFACFPEVAPHIAGLSVMGGAIGNPFTSVYLGPGRTSSTGEHESRIGNTTHFAEFNIWCDPESARSVFTNSALKDKTVVIPLDVTHQACATHDIREMLLGNRQEGHEPTRLRKMFNELLMFFAKTYSEVFGVTEGPPLHDPLAVAVILWVEGRGLLKFDDKAGERWDVDVMLEGEEVGRTVVVKSEKGAIVPRGFDNAAFWAELESCLAKADEATGLHS